MKREGVKSCEKGRGQILNLDNSDPKAIIYRLFRESPRGDQMSNKLTKADIIEAIQKENGYSRKQSSEVTEILLEIIKQSLEYGEDVMVSGFGKFQVKTKKERRGRNPATGDGLILSPRRVVTFKCSDKLRNRINK